jgi:hypothetical protein
MLSWDKASGGFAMYRNPRSRAPSRAPTPVAYTRRDAVVLRRFRTPPRVDSFVTVRTHKSIVVSLRALFERPAHTQKQVALHVINDYTTRLDTFKALVKRWRGSVTAVGEGLFSGAAAAPAKCDILLGDCHLPCQAGSCIRPTQGLHPVTLSGWVRITPWPGSCCGCVWPESVRDIDGNHPVHNEADPSQVESYKH